MEIMWSALIEKAKNNEQDAFYELYQNSYDSVYRTVKSMIKDDDTAMDIVQDTFVKGFASLSALEDPNSFLPWIKRIASNKAKDWFKKKHAIPLSQLADEEGNEPDFEDDRVENLPDEVIDRNETTRLIDEILNTLSDEQRIAVGMFYYQQMSVSEIAEGLGISENTVKSRLNYGRQKIKACVEELEKKGTKLYSLAPIPFLMYLFRNQILQATTGNAPAAVFGNIMAQGAAQVGTAAATATVAQGATAAAAQGSAAAAGSAGGGLLSTVGAKIAAGVLAVSLIGGGIGVGVHMANSDSTSNPEISAERPTSIEEWTDIVAIETATYRWQRAGSECYTVGLRKDGIVLTANTGDTPSKRDYKPERFDVSSWTDIVAISMDVPGSVAGLKADGTVLISGGYISSNEFIENDYSISSYYEEGDWTDIVAIEALEYGIYGLKKDGTVVTTAHNSDNVSTWTDIVAIHATKGYLAGDLFGLKKDGTVVTTANWDSEISKHVAGWKNIVTLFGNDTIFGLKKNGKVAMASKYLETLYNDAIDWSKFVDVQDCFSNKVGLKKDGTVVVFPNDTPGIDIGWKDITAISAGDGYLVGLKSDGTVATVGNGIPTKIGELQPLTEQELAESLEISKAIAEAINEMREQAGSTPLNYKEEIARYTTLCARQYPNVAAGQAPARYMGSVLNIFRAAGYDQFVQDTDTNYPVNDFIIGASGMDNIDDIIKVLSAAIQTNTDYAYLCTTYEGEEPELSVGWYDHTIVIAILDWQGK